MSTPHPFNSPIDLLYNEAHKMVLYNLASASRPSTPPVGFVHYNSDEKSVQIYGGATAAYRNLAYKAAASAENELLVSESLTQTKYGIKRWGGAAGYVKVNASGVVSTQALPIPANEGGTGISAYAVGDILYADSTSTLAKRTIGSANKVLKSNGSNPVWSDYTISDGTNTFTLAKGTASFTLGPGQSITGFIDDDTFATATATTVASSESIKAYVDNRTYDNVSYRPPVDLMFDSSGSSLGATTNTIDGVTVTSGMRVLVKDSATAGQDHKIYLSSGSTGSWVWTVQQDGTQADLPTDGDTVWVKSGNDHEDERWTFNGSEWVQISGTGTYTASLPIEITGSVISHSTANGYKHIPASGSSSQILTYASAGTAQWGYVVNANISSAADIAWSKMADLTANYAVYSNASGEITTEQYLAVSRGGTGKGSWTQYGIVYAPTTGSLGQITGLEGQVMVWGATQASFAHAVTLGKASTRTGSLSFAHTSHTYAISFTPSGSATAAQAYTLPVALPGGTNYILVSNASGEMSWQTPTFADDWKVKVDSGATADYIGSASNNGVLRTAGGLSYADGGNFVTLGLDLNGLAVQLSSVAVGDKLAIADVSDSSSTKWVTAEDFIKTLPGSSYGKQFTFTGSVATGGWAGAGPYTITLKNSGATGNGQQDHGMGTDGKFMVLVYMTEGSYLRETGLSKKINTTNGDIIIESSALFAGSIHVIHLT